MTLMKSVRLSMLASLMALSSFSAHANEIRVPDGGRVAFLKANPDAVELAPATYKIVRDGRSTVVAFGAEAIERQLHAMERRIVALEKLEGGAENAVANTELNALRQQRDQVIANLAADGVQKASAKVSERHQGASCGGTLAVDWNTSYYGLRYYVTSTAVANFAEFGPPSGIPKSGYVAAWGAGDPGSPEQTHELPFALSGQVEWGNLTVSAQGGPAFCPTAGFVAGMSGPRQNNCERVFLRGYDGGPCNIPDPLEGYF